MTVIVFTLRRLEQENFIMDTLPLYELEHRCGAGDAGDVATGVTAVEVTGEGRILLI